MSDVPNVPARPVLPSENEKVVSLREFEQRMFALQQQINDQIRAQQTLADERAASLAQQLVLQAHEYERRLSELNHAHETAQENWRQSLPRELFESHKSEWQHWKDDVNTKLVTLTQIPSGLHAVEDRLKKLESSIQQLNGALSLVRFFGLAGVIALIVTLLRMAKAIP